MPTVTRAGVSLYYELHGHGDEPVVLVMGLGIDAHGWELQVPAFAARHRTLVLDNRGVGRSGKPPGPYTTAVLADDVVAAMDAAGIARAHVVGISMGGMIAQELALTYPERVGALVLAATYARRGTEIDDTTTRGAQAVGRASMLELLGSGQMDLSNVDMNQVFQFLMPLVLSPGFIEAKREWLREFYARSLGYGLSPAGFVAQVAAVMAHDTTARLASLRAPTLVITGTRDRLVPPHHSRELARLIPGATLVEMEGATHGFNMERPEEFNRAVLDFIAAHPLTGAA